jgi:hypothetical protein
MKKLIVGMLLVAVGLCILGFGFAYAAGQTVDFSVPLLDLDGKQIVDPQCVDPAYVGNQPVMATSDLCKKTYPITLGIYAARALSQADKDTPADQSIAAGALAMKVVHAGQIELEGDDVRMIRRQIPKTYGPLIWAQVNKLLPDPAAK